MKHLYIVAALVFLGGCTHTAVEYRPTEKTGCEYQGLNYRYGEIFPAEDGCNSCSCSNDGSITCTEMACGNPAQCSTASDCERNNLETFCEDGAWSCDLGACNYTCNIDTN